jgi:hypothetical protein
MFCYFLETIIVIDFVSVGRHFFFTSESGVERGGGASEISPQQEVTEMRGAFFPSDAPLCMARLA